MKKQVLVIHGGDAFDKYEDYIKYLKSSQLTLERLRARGWKGNLQASLGKAYDVLTPRMPNSMNARYKEWKIWFEKITHLLDNELILIGHSLGGIFIVKYLSENKFPKNIRATFLVAAPYYTPSNHPLVDFNIESSLGNLIKQAGKIYLYHSKDDKIVPFKDFERYKKDLPEAKTRIFANRGHFNSESFPEIVKDLKQL